MTRPGARLRILERLAETREPVLSARAGGRGAPYILFMELKELLRRGSLKTVINTSTNAFDFLKR